MSAHRHRRPNRRAAWLAALALLLQAVLPAFHHPAGMALAGALAPGGAQHLCLAPGGAPVSPGDHDKAPGHHQPECPICQAVHAIGGFAPPAALALAHEPAAAPTVTRIQSAPPASRPSFHPQQPRAPPSLA